MVYLFAGDYYAASLLSVLPLQCSRPKRSGPALTTWRLRTLGIPLVKLQTDKGAVFSRIRRRQPMIHFPESDLVPKRVSLDVTHVSNEGSAKEAPSAPRTASALPKPQPTPTQDASQASAELLRIQKRRERLRENSRRSMELQKAAGSKAGSKSTVRVGSKRAAAPSDANTSKRARPAPQEFLSQALDEEDSLMEDELSEDEDEVYDEDDGLTEDEEDNRKAQPLPHSSPPSRTPLQKSQGRSSAAARQQAPSTPSTPERKPELKKALETLNRLSARRQRIREHMAKTTSTRAPASTKELRNKKLAKAARLKALAKK